MEILAETEEDREMLTGMRGMDGIARDVKEMCVPVSECE